MTYGHALDLLRSCARPLCTRPATITDDAGRLTCARHALEETRMPTAPVTVRLRAAVGEASAAAALLRAATASRHETTAPEVTRDLGAKAEILARYQPDHEGSDWTIYTAPHTLRNGRWVIEWDRAVLHVPDLADVRLARAIVDARLELDRQLRRDVLELVDALGLPNRRTFLRPAARR